MDTGQPWCSTALAGSITSNPRTSKSFYPDCTMKEVTDTVPHSNNINREDGFVSTRCRMEETSPRKYKFVRIHASLGPLRH